MIVPCMVNSWLYCSFDKNCRPGAASSVRISSASSPPMKKNDEAGDAVHDADQLVIGGSDQFVDQVAFGTGPGRVRADWPRVLPTGALRLSTAPPNIQHRTGIQNPVTTRILASEQGAGRVGPTNCRKWPQRRSPGRFGRPVPSWPDVSVGPVRSGGKRLPLRPPTRLSVAAVAVTAAVVATCSGCGSSQPGPKGVIDSTAGHSHHPNRGGRGAGKRPQARRVVRTRRRRGRFGAGDPTGPQRRGSQSGSGRRCPPRRSASWCSPATCSTLCARWACSRGSSAAALPDGSSSQPVLPGQRRARAARRRYPQQSRPGGDRGGAPGPDPGLAGR